MLFSEIFKLLARTILGIVCVVFAAFSAYVAMVVCLFVGIIALFMLHSLPEPVQLLVVLGFGISLLVGGYYGVRAIFRKWILPAGDPEAGLLSENGNA